MSTWTLFLEYAKHNPHKIPKDTKERAKIYRQFVDHCKCNDKHELCWKMGITAVKKSKGSYDPDNDPIVLRAKVRALEELISVREEYIAELEKFLKKRSRAAASV
jgi:hypothetical protein